MGLVVSTGQMDKLHSPIICFKECSLADFFLSWSVCILSDAASFEYDNILADPKQFQCFNTEIRFLKCCFFKLQLPSLLFTGTYSWSSSISSIWFFWKFRHDFKKWKNARICCKKKNHFFFKLKNQYFFKTTLKIEKKWKIQTTKTFLGQILDYLTFLSHSHIRTIIIRYWNYSNRKMGNIHLRMVKDLYGTAYVAYIEIQQKNKMNLTKLFK